MPTDTDEKKPLEPPPPSPMEQLKMQQDAFKQLCEQEGIEGGLANLAATFTSFQVKLQTLCNYSDPEGQEYPEGTPADVKQHHEGMSESLHQARIRLHEVGGWLETAMSQRRTLAVAVCRKRPPPEDPKPE